jgi:hypothetical protein
MVPEFAGRHEASLDRRIGHIHDVPHATRVGGDWVARQDGRPCQAARACPGSGSLSYEAVAGAAVAGEVSGEGGPDRPPSPACAPRCRESPAERQRDAHVAFLRARAARSRGRTDAPGAYDTRASPCRGVELTSGAEGGRGQERSKSLRRSARGSTSSSAAFSLEQSPGTGERAREESRTPNASQGDTDPYGVGRVRVPSRKLEQIS